MAETSKGDMVEGDTPAGAHPAATAVGNEPVAAVGRRQPRILELASAFFLIGLSSFGMAILQNIRSVPVRRGWLSREEIDEGLGLVQLYPGATMVDLVAYVGYRGRRVTGALAAAMGFIAPSLGLMLLLSWLYGAYGAGSGFRSFTVGLQAIVVGVVLNVAVEFAGQHVRGRVEAAVAVTAFAVGVLGQNLVWGILAGLLVGTVALRGDGEPAVAAGLPPEQAGISLRRLGLALVPGVAVGVWALLAVLGSGPLASLSADMLKIGTVAFGNGATILPVLQHDVVSVHHWLSPREFATAVGFGQITPGPFLITAAFVGYRVAGFTGGVVAAGAIFAPSVAMTTVAAELYGLLSRLRVVRGALAGVMAAFVGLLATVVLSLGRSAFPVPAALVLAAAAFVAVRWYRLNVLVVFAAGLAVWELYLLLGGSA
jgi:chromate transporter